MFVIDESIRVHPSGFRYEVDYVIRVVERLDIGIHGDQVKCSFVIDWRPVSDRLVTASDSPTYTGSQFRSPIEIGDRYGIILQDRIPPATSLVFLDFDRSIPFCLLSRL